MILYIPVRAEMDDFISWHYENKGLFSVKSSYHLGVGLKEAMKQQTVGTSNG